MLKRNQNDICHRFITIDETWIYHKTPETKKQTKQWVFRGESAPKSAEATLSANRIMATVLRDVCGMIYVDYLRKGKTINGEFYGKSFGSFNHTVKEKLPSLEKKEILANQHNECVTPA